MKKLQELSEDMIDGMDWGPSVEGEQDAFFVVRMPVFGQTKHVLECRDEIERVLSLVVLPCQVQAVARDSHETLSELFE